MRPLLFTLLFMTGLAVAAPPLPVAEPDLPDGTAKGQKLIATFRHPAGLKVELFAAEPMLVSPVAIALDEKNRVFVAEEYRFNQGTEENRTRAFFLDDDLQIRTVEDRLKMYEKHAGKFRGGMDWFTKHADQVRLLEDTKGYGKADKSTVFAGGFNGPLDGLAAGVLAANGKVYLTCIPNLWELTDTTGKGVADQRKAIHTGFGVNCGFLGHDLHGLTFGPDGKLYFSVGDRGFHVTTQEKTTLSGPRMGAVFRCYPDGSELEVVHRGLRNPQELAFDEYGNLFADDNNCDKGDDARLVYVVEDGDSGWNMAYQSMPAPYMAGPWFAERIWHLQHPGQPAWIVPSVGKLGTGPSGFTFTSGTSLPPRYKNSFLMCNYTGNGGLESFRVKPQGAGFEIADYHDFLKPIRATDCEFGYDGKLYVSDFVDLNWDGGSAGGRIYTVFDPVKLNDPVVLETKKLFADGFEKLELTRLLKLLGHPDIRVRLRAQFTLAERGGNEVIKSLLQSAAAGESQFSQIHAIWCLGQISRKNPKVLTRLAPLTKSNSPEVACQVAKVLGDSRQSEFATELLLLLNHKEPRVQFFAAQALGKLKHQPAMAKLFDVLKSNADKDVYLRHACVTALARIGDAKAVNTYASDESAAVRLAVVLVQRKLGDQRVGQFLTDKDPYVRTEAARAVNDLRMENLYPPLADQLPKIGETLLPDSDALARRAIHAAFRLGTPQHAKSVLDAAVNANYSLPVRAEAISALKDWSDPPQRDRVTGHWHTLTKRDPAVVKAVVEANFPELLAKTSGKLQSDVLVMMLKVGAKVDETTLTTWARDEQKDPNTRVAAMRYLVGQRSIAADGLLKAALIDSSHLVRAEARQLTAEINPSRGLEQIALTLKEDSTATIYERQRAIGTLSELKLKDASKLLDTLAAELVGGEVPVELQVDVWDAMKAAPSPQRDKLLAKFESSIPRDPVGKFQVSLKGGNAERGRDLFYNHTATQCVRCHKINGNGGIAGPDLTKLVERNPDKTRDYILESLVLPNAKIAAGYATVSLTLIDGRIVAGTVLNEDEKSVTTQSPDGKKETVLVDDIDARTVPTSAMPAVDKTLTHREMRDLIQYLASLK